VVQQIAGTGASSGAASKNSRRRVNSTDGWLSLSMPIRYFIWSALVEALVLAPVAVWGIGHAGPEGGILGLISFLLNLPGILCVAGLAHYWDFPSPRFEIAVFLLQTAMLWLFGLLVSWLRRARSAA